MGKEAGIRVKHYQTLWEGCNSLKAKADKLLQLLEEDGLKGKPSIEKCREVEKKPERAQEVAELNLGNIISSEGRPRRGASSLYASAKKEVGMNDSKDSPRLKKCFIRLKKLADSDDSD